jgi:hypothetical protein
MAFSLYVLAGVLAVLNAVTQIALGQTKLIALVGAGVQLALFVVLGSYMRAGRLWARMTLMSLAFVFGAYQVLLLLSLLPLLAENPGGLVRPTLGYVLAELALLVFATVQMYRPPTRGYFR